MRPNCSLKHHPGTELLRVRLAERHVNIHLLYSDYEYDEDMLDTNLRNHRFLVVVLADNHDARWRISAASVKELDKRVRHARIFRGLWNMLGTHIKVCWPKIVVGRPFIYMQTKRGVASSNPIFHTVLFQPAVFHKALIC